MHDFQNKLCISVYNQVNNKKSIQKFKKIHSPQASKHIWTYINGHYDTKSDTL